MKLQLRELPIVQTWDCRACGDCCRRHTVVLDDEDLQRIAAQGWEKRPEFRTGVVANLGWRNPLHVLKQTESGACVFLTDDGKCRIHAEFGEPAKPWPCRMFPFELIPHERDARIAIRMNCPSAAAGLGRPVAAHLPMIRELSPKALSKVTRAQVASAPPAIVSGGKGNWDSAAEFGRVIERLISAPNRPLVRRVASALRFCEMVAAARPSREAGRELRDLMPMFEKSAEDDAKPFFADRRRPTPPQRALFRQVAAEYSRFHPNLGNRPGLLTRLGLIGSALRFTFGSGRVPKPTPDYPDVGFDQLEEPRGPFHPDAVRPIERFIETNVFSFRYCGSARRGLPAVDGFRQLALTLPTSYWLLRWLSFGRDATVEDGIKVAGVVDRSHDYPLLTGLRHQSRTATLAVNDGIDVLNAWYAR